ncbi:MAG: hypothetical protein M1586_01755 [Patescibacteria group bacterium]|nr:hypothetical protein [Patescibacteria group bacterium]MCL5262008.1 hypothetical protein [Patescibacteria group bacterium]
MKKSHFNPESFFRLLKIALIAYLTTLGFFLAWIYGRIGLAERSWENGGSVNLEETKR